MNKTKNNKLFMGIILVALGALIMMFALRTTSDEVSSPNDASKTTQGIQVELNVNDDGTVVSHAGLAGENALEILKSAIEVRVEASDFGEFVTGIGEVDADSSSNFWAFYVNDEQAEVGAGSYVMQEGDQIEWRIEEFNF